MIGIAVNISSLNLVISTTTFYFIETFCGIIISKIHHSILVFDISNFTWYESQITSIITKKMLSYSHFLICPTHSIEVVLKLAGFTPFLIPNVPEMTSLLTEKVQHKINDFLNVDSSSYLIAVPILEFDRDKFKILENAAYYLKNSNKPITFLVFGSGKCQKEFEENIKKIRIQKVAFKFYPFQYDVYPAALFACDVGIYFPESSFTFEISPRILELAVSGIPIIAFHFGCVNEIVKDDVNGIIIDKYDELGPKLKEIFVNESINLKSLRNESAMLNMIQKTNEMCEKAFDEILTKKIV